MYKGNLPKDTLVTLFNSDNIFKITAKEIAQYMLAICWFYNVLMKTLYTVQTTSYLNPQQISIQWEVHLILSELSLRLSQCKMNNILATSKARVIAFFDHTVQIII
jgi:hypothetical protein